MRLFWPETIRHLEAIAGHSSREQWTGLRDQLRGEQNLVIVFGSEIRGDELASLVKFGSAVAGDEVCLSRGLC